MKDYYSSADFFKMTKYDAHAHYHTFDDLIVRKAKKANIRLLSINTNFDVHTIDKQFEISQYLHQRHPQTFDFICTFDASAFASKTFVEDSVAHIKKCMAAGARGVKIWKNIGMTLKNEAGQYIMADDPVFAPIFAFLEKEKIPLLAHLGEPRNCWLPIERMTTSIDRKYFSKNPDFHMYLHPEAPSYEQQIMALDCILERYSDLTFVGAHLGNIDWNLEEAAKRLERFPNFYMDISGRFAHIVEQTLRNRNQVIDFFQTYHNRIMYGSDYFVPQNTGVKWLIRFCKYFPPIVCLDKLFRYPCQTIKKHWLFFATDNVIKSGKKYFKGLKLEKRIIDHLFFENIRYVYYKNCQT